MGKKRETKSVPVFIKERNIIQRFYHFNVPRINGGVNT